MSKRTTGLTISYAIDSASEDEEPSTVKTAKQGHSFPKDSTALPTPESSNENIMPPKRRGRPKAGMNSSATKPSISRGRRTSAGSVLSAKRAGVAKKASTGKRQALTEITNAQDASDVEEVDDFDVLPDGDAPVPPRPISPITMTKELPKKGGVSKSKAIAEKPKASGGKIAGVIAQEVKEIPETQEAVVVQSKLARTQAASSKKPRPAKREIIPETQPEPMQLEDSAPAHQNTDSILDSPQKISTTATNRAVSITRHRQGPSAHRRGGSASDTERAGNDPSLRRKLGDLTKKLEAMELKYNNLRNLGVNDAETTFEKLKRLTDEKTKAANDLISSLRADLKVQSNLASESASLRSQLATLTTQSETLASEKKNLQNSLHDAQNEIKTLQAKVAASRASSTAIQSSEIASGKVPGSAGKNSHVSHRTVLVGSAEAAKEAQKRVLKEELYGDLTGLIVRDVKRREDEGEDVYDCIQTGRNGTLHFHLTVANPTAPSNSSAITAKAPTYEDAEFQYTPLLDENRDRDLIEILPDYLTEEICFPRSNAAKFYARVVDCMTKRVEIVGTDD